MLSNMNNICIDTESGVSSGDVHTSTDDDSMANQLTTRCMANTTNNQSDETNWSLKDTIQHTVSEKTKKRITTIISEIEEFNDIEKLWLYMLLPNGSAPEVDPLKQKGPGNPFGKKADIEVAQTYTWIQSHLEEDSTVSLPKQEVYEEYKVFCEANKFEPLCVADFGKAMKHVFPKVKPRRLGQRGNSKYCYSGLRKRVIIDAPELPILDTSDYESIKSNKTNWESDKNSVLNDESLGESHVIISWATKLLNKSFESLQDLAQFIMTSNSLDVSINDKLLSKLNEEKHLNLKSNTKTMNSSRRRDVQNQLQRKIYEKEAIREHKRRTDLKCLVSNTKVIQSSAPKPIRKNRKNSASKSDSFESMTSLCLQNAIKIKKEPEFEFAPTFITNKPQNKVAIARTVTPSRMSQAAISSIILVPTTTTTLRLGSPQSALSNDNTTTTTVSAITTTSTLKPNITPKYKRIQPKPVNICRSDSESAVAVNNVNEMYETFNSIAKRRHSVSVPIGKETKLKQMEVFSDKQAKPKRQMDEKESSVLATKKRHIDNINTINTMVSNNTNSSGFDDANSSASLSPVSQELQTINNIESVGNTSNIHELHINEIETEALMDYFNSTSFSVTNGGNKDHWEPSSGNQTAQLSQLRKLLENHLPNQLNKTGTQRLAEGVPLEGYSELREALLRKNLNNCVQSYGSGLQNTVDMNESIASAICSKDVECSAKNRQMDGTVESPHNDMHSLSTTTTTTAKDLQFTNGDYITGNVFNDNKSGQYHNVNIQVPSVPPSPNSRRRAFNFQPISPRNTPTIPEHSVVDTINYNGFSYVNSNAMVSSPQYRLNQHTVGVGPSQPSSEANSPFVSPRSTPVTPITPITPLPLTRSRHNSGQSNYSTLRQTPLQTPVDSGVSSISSSPFISPQSTPLPISRVRSHTGAIQRNMSRARHSSGPGGPITSSGMAANLLYNRSNSLSPMISDSYNNGNIGLHCLPFNDTNASQMTSIQMSNNLNKGNNNLVTTGSSLSSLPTLHNMSSLTSDPMNGCSQLAYSCDNDWPLNRAKNGMNDSLGAIRQRHASNPYTSASSTSTSVTPNNMEHFSPEIFSYMKNSVTNGMAMQSNKSFLLNRCQSVPIANIGIVAKNGCHLSPSNSMDLNNQLVDESTSISKSYPATPVCTQPFQFPPSPPSSTKQQMGFGGEDISGNILQSGQDVMVSGVQLSSTSNVWNPTIANTQHNDNDLMAMTVPNIGSNSSNVRRNLSDLLAEPPDDLQTTLEDLRDCDNDFSKFAQQLELEANDCTYDDLT